MTQTMRRAGARQVSRTAIALIKRFEGFRAEAARLAPGGWTIGYGHTRTAREGARVSEADAEALLVYDLIGVAHAIDEWTHAPLSQNQFDALASFVFNIGVENFRRSTTLRRLNEGRMLEAAAAMELWRRADFEGERIVLDALVRRRAVEKALFLKPDAWPVAPSPVLPPKIDYEAADLIPSQTPTALKARLDGDEAVVERDLGDADSPPAFHEPAAPPETGGPRAAADTAAEAAARSVSERLRAIFAEDEATGGAPEGQAPASTAEPPAAPPPAIDAPTLAEAVAAQPGAVAHVAPAPVVRWGKPRRRRRVAGPLALFALGLIGVALFVAAIAFGFQPQAAQAVRPADGAAIGWGLGLVGAALFALAVYGLLSRDRGGLRRDD